MNKNINIIENSSIEMVKGFYSNGTHCGLKKGKELDLGIVYSETKANTYALYTTNKIQGAPLYICREHLKNNTSQVLVVNSKIANTCTGDRGIYNAKITCKEVAKLFNIDMDDVLPMSTGVIGEELPIEKIKKGILELKKILKDNNENNFSKAIMTTDTYPKIKGVKVKIEDKEYNIVGTAKGSGMIYPKMATLLVFIFTDVNIAGGLLKKAFKESINRSFNSITIDGDTSTNDTTIIFANGLAGNKKIDTKRSNEYKIFCEALNAVTIPLAKKIVKDGEGATKIIEINTINAKSIKDAKKACETIANSNLVKTAFFGEDANWGRLLCALGYSGVNFIPEKIKLSIGDIDLFKNGKNTGFNEDKVNKILKNSEIKVNIDLNSGNKNWRVWTSDLSYDYVQINAEYRT